MLTGIMMSTIPYNTNAVAEENFIPSWVKEIAEFWITDQTDDNGFLQVIEYLLQHEIIVVSYDGEKESSSSTQIPTWIKMNAKFWVNEDISDDEFATGLEWLIKNEIIHVPFDNLKPEGKVIKVMLDDGVGSGDR